MKYIIHTLLQVLLVLGLTNICLMLVPKTIRKTIIGTFKFAFRITKFLTIQFKKTGKTLYADYKKETEQPKKRKYSPRKKNTNSPNVIQFPKSNVK